MNRRIHELFCRYKSADAFWAAAENVLTDEYSQELFLRIANNKNHIIHLLEDLEKIQRLAESGNAYMQYAFARLHDTLALEPDSSEICEKYYESALKAGIADAGMQLAFMYRDGDIGEVDYRRYQSYLKRALEEGSLRASQYALNQLVFGTEEVAADEEKAIGIINKYLEESTEDVDPYFYRLRALAEDRLRRKEEAAADYQKATELGDSEAFFLLAMSKCCDEQGNVVDMEGFMELMERGQEAGAPSAYLGTACLMREDYYEAFSEEEKAQMQGLLENELSLGASLGDDYSAYYLGSYYENGDYGLEQDFGKAWQWYSKGALLKNGLCYECLSRMVLEDETASEAYDEAFGYECAYRAYILGSDTLEVLIRGYKNGYLSQHAAVIEEYFLPRYEAQFEDEDYEGPEIEED
ncbi:MAG: hypothetical protein ACI4TL_00300 [Candidatus Cryptobacteroides sp.]